MTVAGSVALEDKMTTGTTEIRKLVCTSGWARNEVRTLNSSCEWCTAWNRHTAVHRWLAQWASQLQKSINSTATTSTATPGTAGSLGTVNHGATSRSIREKPTLMRRTSGTTAMA